MIRPLTCVCMLLAGGSGLYLYQSKHRAHMLDREITRTLKQADATRERIGALRAEWAVLNEPERLADLSQHHLGLRTLAPGQFVTLADLGAKLPPPVAPGTVYLSTEEPSAPQVVAQLVPQQSVPAPARDPVPAQVARPAPRATAAIQAAVPTNPVPANPVQAASLHVPTRQPAPLATPVPAAAPAPHQPPLAPPRPITAPVLTVSASPIQAAQPAPGSIGEAVLRAGRIHQAAPAPMLTASLPPPSAAYAPASASALGGMRSALPPPVPYAGR